MAVAAGGAWTAFKADGQALGRLPADTVQVAGPAERLQRAAAAALTQHRLVAKRDVQQDDRGTGENRGDEQTTLPGAALARPVVLSEAIVGPPVRLNQRDEIVEDVH